MRLGLHREWKAKGSSQGNESQPWHQHMSHKGWMCEALVQQVASTGG